MCDNCDREHEGFVENFDVPDIAGVSLLLLNTLAEAYIEGGYCDPILYKALNTGKQLAERFVVLADEYSDDEEMKAAARDIVLKLNLTIIQAGETINTIIEEHDLPVMKNTFEIDFGHPKAKKRIKKGKK